MTKKKNPQLDIHTGLPVDKFSGMIPCLAEAYRDHEKYRKFAAAIFNLLDCLKDDPSIDIQQKDLLSFAKDLGFTKKLRAELSREIEDKKPAKYKRTGKE